jgi:hypothetical protein
LFDDNDKDTDVEVEPEVGKSDVKFSKRKRWLNQSRNKRVRRSRMGSASTNVGMLALLENISELSHNLKDKELMNLVEQRSKENERNGLSRENQCTQQRELKTNQKHKEIVDNTSSSRFTKEKAL